MSAAGAGPLPASLNGRVAGGFDWASQMDKMYDTDGGLYEKAFTSTDVGRTGRVFGQVLWQQANTKTPWYGMFPKMTGEAPSDIASPRPMNYRAVFNPPEMTSPAEGGQWGDPVEFSSREVEIQPHHSTMRFEGTVLQDLFAQIQDNVPFENLTEIGEEYFQRELETGGIARPVMSSTDSGTQYQDTDVLTMIDRVVASADEEANATDPNGTELADGDLDVYNIDRSDTGASGDNEGNWADSEVNHNGGTLRQLTLSIVDETIEALEQAGTGTDNLVMFTGTDTARVISELNGDKFRADALAEAMQQTVQRGTDEATTQTGHGWDDRLNSYRDIPIVPGPNAPSDGLSRIYLLDMTEMQDPVTGENIPKFGIEQYIPMTVETAGLGQQTNTLALGELVQQHGVLMTQEPRCNRFNHQGKIRDLEE